MLCSGHSTTGTMLLLLKLKSGVLSYLFIINYKGKYYMKKLLAMLVAGIFATSAFADDAAVNATAEAAKSEATVAKSEANEAAPKATSTSKKPSKKKQKKHRKSKKHAASASM